MSRFVALIASASISLLCLSCLQPRAALAAGAVEMQVGHIVSQVLDEYNQAMEAGDPAGWLRYFTENVRREGPLSAQQGKQEFSDYYRWEFQNFQARFVTKKVLVSGRTAAVVFVWEGVHKPSETPFKVDMVGVYELASSGKFESVSFYFDTAKLAKFLAPNAAASN